MTAWAFRPAAPMISLACLRPRHSAACWPARAWSKSSPRFERDGQPVERDLRWGVYVVFKAENDYAASCFKQYGLPTDSTGRYAAMYKPYHLIGLELSISVLNVALRGEPTGSAANGAATRSRSPSAP